MKFSGLVPKAIPYKRLNFGLPIHTGTGLRNGSKLSVGNSTCSRSAYLFVCAPDNTKSCGQIGMKFSGLLMEYLIKIGLNLDPYKLDSQFPREGVSVNGRNFQLVIRHGVTLRQSHQI